MSYYCITYAIDTGYRITDRNQLFPLEKVKSMVALGVRFDNKLTFKDHDHISEKKLTKLQVSYVLIKEISYIWTKHTYITL